MRQERHETRSGMRQGAARDSNGERLQLSGRKARSTRVYHNHRTPPWSAAHTYTLSFFLRHTLLLYSSYFLNRYKEFGLHNPVLNGQQNL